MVVRRATAEQVDEEQYIPTAALQSIYNLKLQHQFLNINYELSLLLLCQLFLFSYNMQKSPN